MNMRDKEIYTAHDGEKYHVRRAGPVHERLYTQPYPHAALDDAILLQTQKVWRGEAVIVPVGAQEKGNYKYRHLANEAWPSLCTSRRYVIELFILTPATIRCNERSYS